MKKYFAKTFMSLCALGISSVAFAQEATETAVEGGMYQALKTKFIEGGADFMSLVAIALIFGLAFCLERIIYLNLAETNSSKLLKSIEDALDKGDVEGAKAIARDTRGPIASIAYQGLMRIDQGIDVVEKSIVSYGGVQGGLGQPPLLADLLLGVGRPVVQGVQQPQLRRLHPDPGHIVAVHLVNAVHGRGQRAHDLSVLLHRAPSSGKNPVSDHTIIRNRIFVKGDFPFS